MDGIRKYCFNISFIRLSVRFQYAKVSIPFLLKKIFSGFYKNYFRLSPTIFPDTPKSFGQKDFEAFIPILPFRF